LIKFNPLHEQESMPYTTEIYKEPFWAKSGDFVRGRDPLGIQNSSIATYSRLLPGMTNLTLRIRYYGFFLWLLQEYHKLPNSSPFKTDFHSQYNFIRRAELVIAFLMVTKFEKEQSIVGSDFAHNHFEIPEIGYYEIAKGADKLPSTVKGTVYWDYSSGAFGQYYVGALIALNLVNSNENYFIITEKGNQLADAFKESISEATRKFLIQIIHDGKLDPAQIAKLSEFAIHQIPQLSAEWEFYKKLMLENDGTYYRTIEQKIPQQRVETIQLFITEIEKLVNKNEWSDFPLHIYSQQGFLSENRQSDASIGWYYYYLNELIHFCLETLFWGLLKEMDGHEYPVDLLIEQLSSKIEEEIKKANSPFDINLTVKDLLNQFTEEDKLDVKKELEAINQFIKRKNVAEAMLSAIFMIFQLYHNNVKHLKTLEDYALTHTLYDKHGNAIEVFHQLLIINNEKKIRDFIPTCLKRIMNDHISIAFKKMGNGEKNLLKFMIEENRLIHIETMQPNFTSPRLRTLHNILTDLYFINTEGEITPLGNSLLTQLNGYDEG
jgi:hypothetical protein